MGPDATERWFTGFARSLGEWAQHRAGVDAADAPVIEVPTEVRSGLARAWSDPEVLEDPGVARWTLEWVGLLLQAGFRALAPPLSPAAGEVSWTETVFDQGVTAAAARTTLPELLGDLRDRLGGLERAPAWRPQGVAGAADAALSALVARLQSAPGWAGREVLMELVRVRPERRLARFSALAVERLDVSEPLRGAASRSLAPVLARSLNQAAPSPEAPDSAGIATVGGLRAWADLEWEAGLAGERGGVLPPVNWRIGVAQRAQRGSDEAFRFALDRAPETRQMAADWQTAADLDLCDALRFADPEPDPPSRRPSLRRRRLR